MNVALVVELKVNRIMEKREREKEAAVKRPNMKNVLF